MPVQYESVLAEHEAVRSGVGVFDVSHLGRFEVSGPDASRIVRRQLCNDIAKVSPGRAQYTMALNDAGGVVDDIIVWRFGDEAFWVMPNGTNFDQILGRFAADAGPETVVEPVRSGTVLLAVQGPDSAEVVAGVIGSMPGRFRVQEGMFAEDWNRSAGTGYTGERGAEIAVPAENGAALFRELVGAGAVPAGLGARDTLRLEMGYPLWGQDLDESTTPLEAGLGWVVSWDHDFVGREALIRQEEIGPAKHLVGFQTEGRAIPRHGYALRSGDVEGKVTSGNFSPSLRRGIGLGYLSGSGIDDDAEIEVEIRGRWTATERIEPPFLSR